MRHKSYVISAVLCSLLSLVISDEKTYEYVANELS